MRSEYQRLLLALIVVGAFVAAVLMRRPAEEVALISPFAAIVLQFFFRKAGPSGG